MIRKNPFDGDSYYALFAQATYKQLMSRQWITYADIMAEYLGLKSAKELPCSISKCDHVKELTKAFCGIRKAIGEEFFIIEGNNRNRRFRYIGKDDDPLVDMRNAKVINNLRQYWRFCQDSAGFFPASWLEYFFKDCRDLLEIKSKKQKGELVLSASLDRNLTNIELLPFLYEAIVKKCVLSIEYKPYEEEVRSLTFHPHYLKEFNGRWHLFGHVDRQTPEYGYNIALDRIVGTPIEIDNQDYMPAPINYYKDFFQDIIGVSHLPDAKVYVIRVRARTFKIFKLIETKKLHHSQETTVPYGIHEDEEYGEFSIRVEVNNELIGSILQMGAGLEIVSPDEVREFFKQRVADLSKLYE